jgi:hypothetical protein
MKSATVMESKLVPISHFLIVINELKPDLDSKKTSLYHPEKNIHGYISIQDNGLTYDNILYFSISKNKKSKCN